MSVYRTCPTAPGANVGRHSRRAGRGPQGGDFDLAVQRFNVSAAARTVCGLTRTLGTPWVSVGAVAGSPTEARVTVAWELTWYQWAVDLDDATRPVFELARGTEIDQLDRSARQWNARADRGGRLVL